MPEPFRMPGSKQVARNATNTRTLYGANSVTVVFGLSAFIIAAVFIAMAPLDNQTLALAAVGMLVCLLLQQKARLRRQLFGKAKGTSPTARATVGSGGASSPAASCSSMHSTPRKPRQRLSSSGSGTSTASSQRRQPQVIVPQPLSASALSSHAAADHPDAKAAPAQRPEWLLDSKVPVVGPSFAADEFDRQVEELLPQITPSLEAERAAQELARCAEKAIQQILPEIHVVGVANGDLGRGTAFGVAVPEVDLIANASPHALIQHLQGRLEKGGISSRLDARQLQKSAIRACTDMLVSHGGFKFRRSAFRGQEPKVTLMAPASLGVAGRAIPIDFSVNSATPLYNAELVTECAKIDERAKALIMLVKRWAKDRGICHAAKGHLPPYAWSLLVAYFLQVGVGQTPLLPPMQGFKAAPRLTLRRGRWSPQDALTDSRSSGDLFRTFFRFYAKDMDWKAEAVSVRLGQRAPASLQLALHMILREDQSTEVGPSVEDPFEPARNLGTSLTTFGLARLREELARADAILSSSQPNLAELLELWMPVSQTDQVPLPMRSSPQRSPVSPPPEAVEDFLCATPDSSQDVEQILRWIEEDERQERQ